MCALVTGVQTCSLPISPSCGSHPFRAGRRADVDAERRMTASFPAAFADLEPFAEPWIGLDTMAARYRARQDMPFAALKHFYDVTTERLAGIMAYLDGFVVGGNELPPAEGRLFRLALGWVELGR